MRHKEGGAGGLKINKVAVMGCRTDFGLAAAL